MSTPATPDLEAAASLHADSLLQIIGKAFKLFCTSRADLTYLPLKPIKQ